MRTKLQKLFVTPAALLGLLLSGAGSQVGAQETAAQIAAQVKREAKKHKSGPTPAKKLFGTKKKAAKLAPRAIGFYSRGCLAGAEQVPIDGPAWQAMRLSRNRNWGHPVLVDLIQRLAVEAKREDGWNGLLVGDLAQPRGGPMLTGHASHQVGLDADIWLTPMPEKRFTIKERETVSAISMLADKLSVNRKVWTPAHVRLIKRAASYPEVARIGVNPAIKLALCRDAGGERGWLRKIQSWAGHHYHMHIRIKCPKGSTGCRDQGPPRGTSCAAAEKWYRDTKAWMERVAKGEIKPKPRKKRKPKAPITLAGLPSECKKVLAAKPAPAVAVEDKIVPPKPKPAKRASVKK